MRVTGVEPARLSAREPKSRMSANSIIPAYYIIKLMNLWKKPIAFAIGFFVERLTRLELATSTLARWRSTGWAKAANGGPGRNRTNDTRIFSPLLYQLSYRAILVLKKWRPGRDSNPRPLAWQASVLTIWTTGPHIMLFVWWAFTDSNRGPIGYEPTALTNWAKGPH